MIDTELTVGTQVVRVLAGLGYRGMRGTVVELGEGRVRVLWQASNNGDPLPKARQKRTWVNRVAVVAV